jgi:hypothetical protein
MSFELFSCQIYITRRWKDRGLGCHSPKKTRYMAYIDDTIMAGQCSCHRSFSLLFTRPLLLLHLSYLVSFWLCWRLASTHGSGLVSCRNSSRTHLTARQMRNCHNFSFARKLFKSSAGASIVPKLCWKSPSDEMTHNLDSRPLCAIQELSTAYKYQRQLCKD